MTRALGCILAVAAFALVPQRAKACGGLFCSAQNSVAVEQNAERILFVDNADGTFSAYVEIQYTGAPSAFSWVVPVPATPQLDVAPPSTLRLLDLMTRPTIVSPPTQCGSPVSDSGFVGCGAEDAVRSAQEDTGGVRVEELPRVGPFEPKVVSAEDPKLLYDWLTDNGYLLTAEMRPIIEKYGAKGMKFLALRLAPGANVSDIAPIKMTYQNPCPMVPLALTAISAEPEMSVLVLFLGKTRMRSTNYANLTIKPSDVRMDGAARDNYYALVSHRIDEAGGRAFVTELAGKTTTLPPTGNFFLQTQDQQEAQQHVSELVANHPYVTRLYARLSAWEMTLDPEFEASDDGDVANRFDLSQRPAIEICGEQQGVQCGSTYCGPGSQCGVDSDGNEGCVCKTGTVARAVTSPDLRRGSINAVACQDAAFQILYSAQLVGPCENFACGGGKCVVTNGFPTCQCAPGQLARLDPNRVDANGKPTGMLCETPSDSWGPERLTWQEGGEGCAVGAGMPLAIVGLLALRRRRRMRA